MFKNSLILIAMKVLYLFLVLTLCSCASTGYKVVSPTRIESYKNYQEPDSLTEQVEDELKKKKWNR